MQIVMRTAFADNYIFLLPEDEGSGVAVVDPGLAEPVEAYLQSTGRCLTAILNTHHHHDHTGGNRKLLEAYPDIAVYGGAGDRGRIPGQTHFVREGDRISLSGMEAMVLDVPGHTRAHIAYYVAGIDGEGDLFSGDTVFGGTIGNLFEGTPDTMFESIRKIRSLPRKTRIWAAHEYTLQFVREAARLDPNNACLVSRLKRLEEEARVGKPSIPLTLQEECCTNPFFRWDDPALAKSLSKTPGLETFRHLCEIT